LPRRPARKRTSSSIPAPTICATSTGGGVDVVDYPDSKKIAVAAGIKNADFKTATYVGLGRLAPAEIKENCPEASNPGNHNSHRNQLTNGPTTHKASRFAILTGANRKRRDNGYCD
jgi:hypothetical protein